MSEDSVLIHQSATTRSAREFCARFFPRAHAAKTCCCYPKPKCGVLVIRSRRAR